MEIYLRGEEMTYIEMFDYLVEKIENRLIDEGFKRSSKSLLFYRYNEGKTRAWAINIQKSRDNTLDGIRFSFNYIDVCAKDLATEVVTLESVRKRMTSGFSNFNHMFELSSYSIFGMDVERYWIDSIEVEIDKIIKKCNN